MNFHLSEPVYFNLICEINDSVMWFIENLWETKCLIDSGSLTASLFLAKRSCLYIPYNLAVVLFFFFSLFYSNLFRCQPVFHREFCL